MDFNRLFQLMIDKKASQLHLVPGSPIMMRQDNLLIPVDNAVLTPDDTNQFVQQVLPSEQKQVFEKQLELNFAYSIPGLSRFRVTIFRQRGSVAAVIATNPPSPPSIEELGLPEMIKQHAINTKSGLIIICGPKSSGKSHTLAAMVNYILEMRTCQVVTLENPIDFLHKNKKGVICQREIGSDTRSYEEAFRTLVHQDADVLVVSDLNSYVVANNVLNLAAGGSLVIATGQAPNITVMLDKLVDLFPPHQSQQVKSLLGVGLETIVSQTLLTKTTGAGMVAAFEILYGTPQVKSLIREGKFQQLQTVMGTTGREFGMQTQEQAMRFLVKKGIVTQDEAATKAVRPEEFKKLMSLPY